MSTNDHFREPGTPLYQWSAILARSCYSRGLYGSRQCREHHARLAPRSGDWRCTRLDSHTGRHEAIGPRDDDMYELCATWDDVPETETNNNEETAVSTETEVTYPYIIRNHEDNMGSVPGEYFVALEAGRDGSTERPCGVWFNRANNRINSFNALYRAEEARAFLLAHREEFDAAEVLTQLEDLATERTNTFPRLLPGAGYYLRATGEPTGQTAPSVAVHLIHNGPNSSWVLLAVGADDFSAVCLSHDDYRRVDSYRLPRGGEEEEAARVWLREQREGAPAEQDGPSASVSDVDREYVEKYGITKTLLDKVKEIATEAGHCHEFDQICTAAGLPGRKRGWAVPVIYSARATYGVEAETEEEAIALAEAQVMAAGTPHLTTDRGLGLTLAGASLTREPEARVLRPSNLDVARTVVLSR